MNKELKSVLDEAKELENDINALGIEQNKDDVIPKPHERKIRFAADGEQLKKSDGVWQKRDVKPDDFNLEQLALARMVFHARDGLLPDAFENRFQNLADSAKRYTMTTGGTGTGAELVDTILWNQLFEDVHAATLVANLFKPFIPMTSGKMELSEMGDATFYKPAGEGQAVTATDLATGKRSLTAYLLKAQVDISDEEDEDSVIAMIPTIRSKLVRNAAEVIDEVILNGDSSTGTQNINYYAASGGSNIGTDSRFLLGFDGLIHYCLNEVTGQVTNVGALGAEDFAALISLLGKYADNPKDCAFVVDRWVKNKSLQASDFETVDKLGDRATLLNGMLGEVYGIPIIMSAGMAKSNDTGQVDQTSGNNTKGRLVLVNRKMWKVGFRRSIRVATERSEAKGLTSIVATMRVALQCYGDRSSADYCHTALGYNVTV